MLNPETVRVGRRRDAGAAWLFMTPGDSGSLGNENFKDSEGNNNSPMLF